MNHQRLLAVDGGGSSTTAWLTDRSGRILGSGEAGPSNAKLVGLDVARANLHRSIAGAFSDAGGRPCGAELACFGLAGFDRQDDRHVISGWPECARWARRTILVNDGDIVLAAGTPEGYGVALIAATGSIAVGRSHDGAIARAGGWGHILGDEGSAYAVAQAALRKVVRRADGRLARPGFDLLSKRICEALGMADPSGLVSAVYSPSFDHARIAALAPIVVAVAEDDPEIHEEILVPAGYELAASVAAVIRALTGFPDRRGPIPLAISGGFILSARTVMHAMLDRLANQGFEVAPTSVEEPVRGALVLARRALNGEETPGYFAHEPFEASLF